MTSPKRKNNSCSGDDASSSGAPSAHTASLINTHSGKKNGSGGPLEPQQDTTPVVTHDYEEGRWPKILVISSTTSGEPLKLGQYAVAKGILGLTNNAKKLTKTRSGHFVVEVTTDLASKVLLSAEALANQKVSVTPHRTLNESKGVITSRFLEGATNEDLLADLKSQGVTKVHRILRHKRVPTNAIILSFVNPTPNPKVRVHNVSLEVKPFVEAPRRCYKCQKFGHTKTRCSSKNEICAKCAGDHVDRDCKATTFKCANCKDGQHQAFDKKCPKYVEIKSLLEISGREKISMKDAKKKLGAQKKATYAAKAAQLPNTNQPQVVEKLPEAELQPAKVCPKELKINELAAIIVKQNGESKQLEKVIAEQTETIQCQAITILTERNSLPADTEQMQLLKAQVDSLNAVTKRQEQTINELQKTIMSLQKKLEAQEEAKCAETSSPLPISSDLVSQGEDKEDTASSLPTVASPAKPPSPSKLLPPAKPASPAKPTSSGKPASSPKSKSSTKFITQAKQASPSKLVASKSVAPKTKVMPPLKSSKPKQALDKTEVFSPPNLRKKQPFKKNPIEWK